MDGIIQSAIDAIKTAIGSQVDTLVFYLTLQFLDPFWGLLAMGIAAIAALCALAWFFGDFFSGLKPIIGALVLGIITALASIRYGEGLARGHDAKKKPKKRGP